MPKGFFDFEEVVNKDEGFEKIVEKAQKNLQKSPSRGESVSTNRLPYLIIFILLIGLIGVSLFAFGRGNSSNSSENTVAAVQRDFITEPSRIENIISGQAFSIVVNDPTPENFSITEDMVDFVFLNNQKGLVTKILATNPISDTEEDQSGLEIYTTEYDNRLNINSFATEVQNSLGSSYDIDGEVEIPKGFKIIRINNPSDKDVTYYTGVTSENYYVIKVINTAQNHSRLREYSSFVDKMIPGLYLN